MSQVETTLKEQIFNFLTEEGAPASFGRIADELGENVDATDALSALGALRREGLVDKLSRVFYVGGEIDLHEAYATRAFADAAFKEWSR